MSTAQALRNLERDLGAELDRDMNVVALKKSPVSLYVAPDPENEQDRIAAAHRHSITKRKQRISDTKKGLKATLASIAAARKEEKARHVRRRWPSLPTVKPRPRRRLLATSRRTRRSCRPARRRWKS